jgi:type IX secretion system PorP/SprF family membrane protein
MKRFNKILFTGFVFLLALSLSAQQDGDIHYTQYMFNRLMINPATTGLKDAWDVGFFYRNQWTSRMPGAPVNELLTVQTGLKNKKFGMGGFVMNDKIGLENRVNASFNCAYHIRDDKYTLSFGLQVGMKSYFLNTSALDAKDKTDEDLYNGLRTPVMPDFAFGFNYTKGDFYGGFSVTHLNQSPFKYSNLLTQSSLKRHYYANAGYNYVIDPVYTLKPSMMLRYVPNSRMVMDISTLIDIKKKYWAGLNYRTGDAIGLILGIDLDQMGWIKYDIKVGYAYDHTVSRIPRYNVGSHEIMLSYTSKRPDKKHIPKFQKLEF